MHFRQAVALLALAAVAAGNTAYADTVFTVTATYDPFITGDKIGRASCRERV